MPLTYAACVSLALADHDSERGLTTKQICAWLEAHQADVNILQRARWKTSIRHCLSEYKCFWQPSHSRAWRMDRQHLPKTADKALKLLEQLNDLAKSSSLANKPSSMTLRARFLRLLDQDRCNGTEDLQAIVSGSSSNSSGAGAGPSSMLSAHAQTISPPAGMLSAPAHFNLPLPHSIMPSSMLPAVTMPSMAMFKSSPVSATTVPSSSAMMHPMAFNPFFMGNMHMMYPMMPFNNMAAANMMTTMVAVSAGSAKPVQDTTVVAPIPS
ncbi:uncharacterized protein MONBRDRAFT_32604 [Monosiga brevicollis MX1]|uniref:Fork-head domain-containing protein n=1 Tax=Monosiga brevicollis TaxID=81824 RepID=A9V0L6_MONBE|nr:uncharacterized protein MONBRDRAFT_32604 [Monosiga brevicollis MX1]EDQ89173.1 predicted protein [Monosiga brevicollis MX1]|eukprot:XP_001746278.1 hypothetical protein [Monosiga brevicollis MX1]